MAVLPMRRVIFVPAAHPPHRIAPSATSEDRLAMVRLAVGQDPRFEVNDIEYHRFGPSYTVDTLAYLKGYHREPLALILGVDAFLQLPTWHRWRRILALAHVVIVQRPGWDGELPSWIRPRLCEDEVDLLSADYGRAFLCRSTQHPESASVLRALIARDCAPGSWLPTHVRTYIDDHHLYREKDGK